MFEFARNSAKAVLVAAGAAGFAALGAGAAAAAPAAPQALSPLTDAAPLMAAGALAPVTAPLAAGEVPEMAGTAPAPDTRNLILAGSDASGAGGAVDQGLTTFDGAVDQALGQNPAVTQRQSAPVGGKKLTGNPAKGLNGTVHSSVNRTLNGKPGVKSLRQRQSALPGNPAAGHPAKGLNGLVHGTVNSTPKGNPAPGAGGTVRDAADTVSDMVVVAEQDDVHTMSAEEGAPTDLVGGVADQAEGAVGQVLPNTARELDTMSEEPPVAVDEGAVGDTVADTAGGGLPTGGVPTDGLPTQSLAAEELPAPESVPADGLPTDGLPTDGLPADAASTESLNADVTDGLAVGPELPAPGGLTEVPLG